VVASASLPAVRQLRSGGRENRAAVPKDRQVRVTGSNSADRATAASRDRRCGAGHRSSTDGPREKHEGPGIPPHASGGRETVAPEHPRRESDVRGGLTPLKRWTAERRQRGKSPQDEKPPWHAEHACQQGSSARNGGHRPTASHNNAREIRSVWVQRNAAQPTSGNGWG
jgi:hypothetical protein